MKKLLLTLGTLAAITAPVASVVACGSSTPENTNGTEFKATEGSAADTAFAGAIASLKTDNDDAKVYVKDTTVTVKGTKEMAGAADEANDTADETDTKDSKVKVEYTVTIDATKGEVTAFTLLGTAADISTIEQTVKGITDFAKSTKTWVDNKKFEGTVKEITFADVTAPTGQKQFMLKELPKSMTLVVYTTTRENTHSRFFLVPNSDIDGSGDKATVKPGTASDTALKATDKFHDFPQTGFTFDGATTLGKDLITIDEEQKANLAKGIITEVWVNTTKADFLNAMQWGFSNDGKTKVTTVTQTMTDAFWDANLN